MLPAAAADAPPSAARTVGSTPSAELVKPGLYRVNGAGGGTLLRIGTSGLIVVDANRAGTYRPLKAEIERIASSARTQVSALVLTGAGPEQSGNVAQFVDAGGPVIVQRRALARLVAEGPAGTAASKSFVAYDDDYMLRVGDLEAEIEHVGRGRSAADSVVLFRDLRVVAVGELYTDTTPTPECASGGSFAGWAAAIDHLLWSDFDVAVPSRGAPVGKRELTAFKAKLLALAAQASSSPSVSSDCRPTK